MHRLLYKRVQHFQQLLTFYKNQITIFETSGTRLLDALYDVNTDEKMMSGRRKIIPSDPEHRN